LLDQHNAEARAPKPWQQIDEGGTSMPAPGYQSTQAAHKAQELHAAESRLASIQGSVSTRDRKNQGKRDHRNES
ncbi:hypothetical protein SB719_19505, partial [Pantoea sp. SIMBA_079]|uniref:hypothetical protein n=1 Tax=Pantoea sp. SIMBA_079 TaxID=3085817 RepID=UPI003995590E